MDVTRLAAALQSMQGGDAPGRYRYGGAGGESIPLPEPEPQGLDFGALIGQLLGFSQDGPLPRFGGGAPETQEPTQQPTPWQERGYTLNGNVQEKNDILRTLLGQLG